MPAVKDRGIIPSYVKENGQATIVCPECNLAKIISVKKFPKRVVTLKVKCACLHPFKVKLEYRQSYRKDVDLLGTVTFFQPNDEMLVKIVNMSMGGMCFNVVGRHSLEVGQKGGISFTLDNKKRTELTRSFHIRSLVGNKVCCEFVHDLAFEKDLGFYLLP